MLLRLPPGLHYPIVLTKIEKRPGDSIQKNDPLFLYSYKTTVKQGERYSDEETEVVKTFVTHFRSTLDGVIKLYRVWEGDVLEGPADICEVDEECPHTVQYQGICTNCGKDMTEIEAGSGTSDMERAPIRMAHDTPHLTISKDEAATIDEESKRRLLAARKLSLVVDLDQTIIHAAVDPTIGEWQKDPDNPNYDAIKDVRSFQLLDDGPGMRGCWYYIKLRPGLAEFLESIAALFELHIYTMGTRQYAQKIAEIVDPDHRFFGDRILSRDESGSMVAKNLERLFPVDTKMVVIIDDRGDVWKWSANLIRVTPFDFFVGIGDINSSFLPKKQEIQATAKPELPKMKEAQIEAKEEATENGDVSSTVAEDGTSSIQEGTTALEHLIAMGGSDDPAVRELQTKGQEDIISSQLEEKPLLKMQREQDEKDKAEAAPEGTPQTNGEAQHTQATESDSDSSDSEASQSKPKARHSILKNDDEELVHLESSLSTVHAAFFKEWDRKRLAGKGGRVAALAGKKKLQLEDETPNDLTLVPDVKRLMPAMKVRVLSGVTIVFSGVLPLGTDIQNADISTWAKTFGATVTDKVTRDVTHVIAARAGTAKVKQAVKRGIKVVGTNWLIESMQRWRRLEERPYLLEGAGKLKDDTSEHGDPLEQAITSQDFMLSSSDEDSAGPETDGDEPARKKPRLEISTENRDIDDDEEGSPLTLDQAEWDDIDAELKEFLGSDAESESDAESVNSSLSYRQKRKRNRDAMEQGSGAVDGNRSSSPKGGGSRLKAVANVSSEKGSSGSNTPRSQRDEDEAIARDQREAGGRDLQEQAEEEDSDDELARELERELEEAGAEDD